MVELLIFAASTDPLAIGGAVSILLLLAGYFLRSYSQNSAGTWKIVRERERDNERLRWEVRYWQWRAGVGTDPGPAPNAPNVDVETRDEQLPKPWVDGPEAKDES